jgi:hypothetical protein
VFYFSLGASNCAAVTHSKTVPIIRGNNVTKPPKYAVRKAVKVSIQSNLKKILSAQPSNTRLQHFDRKDILKKKNDDVRAVTTGVTSQETDISSAGCDDATNYTGEIKDATNYTGEVKEDPYDYTYSVCDNITNTADGIINVHVAKPFVHTQPARDSVIFKLSTETSSCQVYGQTPTVSPESQWIHEAAQPEVADDMNIVPEHMTVPSQTEYESQLISTESDEDFPENQMSPDRPQTLQHHYEVVSNNDNSMISTPERQFDTLDEDIAASFADAVLAHKSRVNTPTAPENEPVDHVSAVYEVISRAETPVDSRTYRCEADVQQRYLRRPGTAGLIPIPKQMYIANSGRVTPDLLPENPSYIYPLQEEKPAEHPPVHITKTEMRKKRKEHFRPDNIDKYRRRALKVVYEQGKQARWHEIQTKKASRSRRDVCTPDVGESEPSTYADDVTHITRVTSPSNRLDDDELHVNSSADNLSCENNDGNAFHADDQSINPEDQDGEVPDTYCIYNSSGQIQDAALREELRLNLDWLLDDE